jgi:hypothetical protein
VTEIDTTDGVTKEEIALAFIPELPISTKVRFEEHEPVDEIKSAPVRLSAQAVITEELVVVAAVATPPATTAPIRNAALN